jgi:hypothetical protein
MIGLRLGSLERAPSGQYALVVARVMPMEVRPTIHRSGACGGVGLRVHGRDREHTANVRYCRIMATPSRSSGVMRWS